MKHVYIKRFFVPIITLLLFNTQSFQLFAQCSVTAPPGVTISCGASTTLTASTTQVTYNVVSVPCAPVAIAGATAFATACDDCVTGQIPIGFPFNFFGNIYTTAVIQSNGILGFGPFTFTGFSSFSIPSGGIPNNYIAGFFADIDIRCGGTITYATVGVAPNRRFVVSYNNVSPFGGGSPTCSGTGTASFQIILNENGSFNVEVSQLSANWNASTSGALATSGAENDNGLYAVIVPGRNATDWPGITAGQLDCNLFNATPCVFQNWQLGGSILTASPALTVSPTTSTTYTAVWNCGGSVCTANSTVTINSALTLGGVTDNTNCAAANGSIGFNTTGFADGNYTFNYTLNGAPVSTTVTITGGTFTLSNLSGGTFTNFSLVQSGCTTNGTGTATVTSPTSPATVPLTICQGGSGVITSAACGTTATPIAQSTVFNSGALTTTDLTWNRNGSGTTCGATAGTSYYYDVFPFTVTTAGSYTFDGCFPAIDAHASLYQNNFNGANPCGTPGDFIIADDDGNSATCSLDPKLTATLSPGITYYIVSTTFSSLATDTYSWSYTGPVGATILSGSAPATLQWYTTPTGGSSISSATSFNPVGVAGSGLVNTNTAGTTIYYAACSNSPTCRTATNFTINAQSVNPSSISGGGTFCIGQTANLAQVGGSLSPTANWNWYTGACNGTLVGTGNTLSVTPTVTTTYYVNASATSTCPATACVPVTVTMPIAGTVLSNNNESATCTVNQNGYVHFYHSSGRLIASINSLGQNLGNVTATSYTGVPVNMPACNAPSYMATAMGRHWVITPQFQPATPIDVVLHFDQTEYNSLQTAANANISPFDNLTGIADLKLSKYSGPLNVDDLVTNNCVSSGGSGGTTIHAQAANGNITTLIPGFSATGRFTRHTIPSCSEFWLHGSSNNSPLPVDLISFGATCASASEARIQWSTQSEVNCSNYVLERSNGNGAWQLVESVPCQTNTQNLTDYEVLDANRLSGTSYYRLTQVDNNNFETVYEPIALTCQDLQNTMYVFPNPASTSLTVYINSLENLGESSIVITDISGKGIQNKIVNLAKGQTSVYFETEYMSKGVYFVKVNDQNNVFETIKIIIQ